MTIKTFLTATALVAASAFSAAAECSWQKQAMSCSDGMVYDSASQACVTVNS